MPKKKTKQEDQSKKLKSKVSKTDELNDDDNFDFGGFPKGISIKKNLGCGG